VSINTEQRKLAAIVFTDMVGYSGHWPNAMTMPRLTDKFKSESAFTSVT
jgi:hypothetical protein